MSSATPTAGPSPRPRPRRSSPSAGPCHPRSAPGDAVRRRGRLPRKPPKGNAHGTASPSTPLHPVTSDPSSHALDNGSSIGNQSSPIPEAVGSGRVPQLGHRLGLDLADPLPGDPVGLADLIEGPGLAAGQPEPHGHHAGLA